MYDPLAGCGSWRADPKNTVINLAAVPSSANSRAFSQLLELGKLNDLVSELTSAEEEEERRRRRTPQLRRNETAESAEEEVTVFAAEAESAAKSERKKAVACDVEQKSVEGGFKRQNQVRA